MVPAPVCQEACDDLQDAADNNQVNTWWGREKVRVRVERGRVWTWGEGRVRLVSEAGLDHAEKLGLGW